MPARPVHELPRQVDVTRTLLTCDERRFRIHATLDAYENGLRIYAKTWDEKLPRMYL